MEMQDLLQIWPSEEGIEERLQGLPEATRDALFQCLERFTASLDGLIEDPLSEERLEKASHAFAAFLAHEDIRPLVRKAGEAVSQEGSQLEYELVNRLRELDTPSEFRARWCFALLHHQTLLEEEYLTGDVRERLDANDEDARAFQREAAVGFAPRALYLMAANRAVEHNIPASRVVELILRATEVWIESLWAVMGYGASIDEDASWKDYIRLYQRTMEPHILGHRLLEKAFIYQMVSPRLTSDHLSVLRGFSTSMMEPLWDEFEERICKDAEFRLVWPRPELNLVYALVEKDDERATHLIAEWFGDWLAEGRIDALNALLSTIDVHLLNPPQCIAVLWSLASAQEHLTEYETLRGRVHKRLEEVDAADTWRELADHPKHPELGERLSECINRWVRGDYGPTLPEPLTQAIQAPGSVEPQRWLVAFAQERERLDPDAQMDVVFDTFDEALLCGEFAWCDSVIQSVVQRADVGWEDIVVGILTLTLGADKEIKSRSELKDFAELLLRKTVSEEEAALTLKSL